jgi:signal peptidase I
MEHFYTETFPEPDPTSPKNTPAGLRHFIFDLLETILLSVVLFLGINALSARIRVESISMQPTLYEGNFVIVNKVAYKIGLPERGDVIVFHFPLNPTIEPYIKRVVGLPGEQVTVKEGKVFINSVPLTEPYIKAPPSYSGTWNVPQDSLFVLGDNRNNSSDSHSWGMVPLKNVIGKAEVVYWPPTRWQWLHQDIAAAATP